MVTKLQAILIRIFVLVRLDIMAWRGKNVVDLLPVRGERGKVEFSSARESGTFHTTISSHWTPFQVMWEKLLFDFKSFENLHLRYSTLEILVMKVRPPWVWYDETMLTLRYRRCLSSLNDPGNAANTCNGAFVLGNFNAIQTQAEPLKDSNPGLLTRIILAQWRHYLLDYYGLPDYYRGNSTSRYLIEVIVVS